MAKELTGEDIVYKTECQEPDILTLPVELSRDEAIRIALFNNKDLQASLYDLGIAKMSLEAVVLFQNPLVAVSNVSPLNQSAINLVQFETQLLNIPDLIQIPLRRKMFTTQLEIAIYTFVAR